MNESRACPAATPQTPLDGYNGPKQCVVTKSVHRIMSINTSSPLLEQRISIPEPVICLISRWVCLIKSQENPGLLFQVLWFAGRRSLDLTVTHHDGVLQASKRIGVRGILGPLDEGPLLSSRVSSRHFCARTEMRRCVPESWEMCHF